MKPLLDAIYTKFSGSAFSTSIGGRLYFQQAPESTTFPFCVYDLVDYRRDDTFAYQYDLATIQFAIYDKASTKGVTSPATLMTAQDNLWALYDYCALTITGWNLTAMKRTTSLFRRDTDANILQALTVYEVRITK